MWREAQDKMEGRDGDTEPLLIFQVPSLPSKQPTLLVLSSPRIWASSSYADSSWPLLVPKAGKRGLSTPVPGMVLTYLMLKEAPDSTRKHRTASTLTIDLWESQWI